MSDEAGGLPRDGTLPVCFKCAYDGLGHPCRAAGGGLDFAKIGRALVKSQQAYATDAVDDTIEAETRWAADCTYEIEQDHPELLLPLIVAAMDACTTIEEAAFIAAGLVENAIVKHGPALIGKIEELAGRSDKFRYILSGVWSQGSVDPDVWARIGHVVGQGGRMSDDGRGPWDGNPVTVLSDEDALALLRERVSAAASGLI